MLAEPILERRVTKLEDLMADLIAAQKRTDQQLNRTDQQLNRTDQQIESTEQQVNRTSREMREFKEEMSDFKEEMRQSRIEMRRQWGELSNKLGTMVEDLVAPSIGRILTEVVGCREDELEHTAVRVRRRSTVDNSLQEFDTIAVCPGYLLINQTKSKLKPEDIPEFIQLLSKARAYFPEYAENKVIGVIASLYVDESLVRHGERQGLLVLGFGDDVMQVLNSPNFIPRPL